MSNDAKPAAEVNVPKQGTPEAAIQSLATMFGDAVQQLVQTTESQQTGILALTAMMALVPGTADIDAKRLAVIVQTLTQNREDADVVREKIAAYVAAIVGIAKNMPEAMAVAEGQVDEKGS